MTQNRKEKWVSYWDERALNPNPKIAHGRGSYPDNVYYSIHKDIVDLLNIDNKSSILDIGGGIGYFLKQIINKCNPLYTHLIESSKNSVVSFNEWLNKNDISNSESSYYILPDMPKGLKKYNKIICGSTLGYLNSLEEVKISVEKMYNLLEDDGEILLFHHHNTKSPAKDILLFDLNICKNSFKSIGFKTIKEVKIGPYYGEGACGKYEFSVYLKK